MFANQSELSTVSDLWGRASVSSLPVQHSMLPYLKEFDFKINKGHNSVNSVKQTNTG